MQNVILNSIFKDTLVKPIVSGTLVITVAGAYFLWYGIHKCTTLRSDAKQILSKLAINKTEKFRKHRNVIVFDAKANLKTEGVIVKEVGGKGFSLINMSNYGINVPPGIVLTTQFFEPWIEYVQSLPTWNEFMSKTDMNVIDDVTRACDKVKRDCEDKLTLTELQTEEILESLKGFSPDTLFAIRSSSPEEDLAGSSFAGGYETILAVPNNLEKIASAIKTVFISCLDARVVVYKKKNNFNIFKPSIAVVIQQQILSFVAGVAFSINPINNSYDEAVINSNWGVGESVVSGEVSPDQFIVDKYKRVILDKKLGTKEKVVVVSERGGTETINSDHVSKYTSSLNDQQVIELTDELVKIEKLYGSPVDIEYAFDRNHNLYLLQCRPVTTHVLLPPDMVTTPSQQKYLYLDVTTTVQGILEPMSVLGQSMVYTLLSGVLSEMIASDSIIGNGHKDLVIIGQNGRLYFNVAIVFNIVDPITLSTTFGKMMDGTLENMLQQAIKTKEYNPKSWIKYKVFFGLLSSGILKKLYYFMQCYVWPQFYSQKLKRIIRGMKLQIQYLAKSTPPKNVISKIIKLVNQTLTQKVLFILPLSIINREKLFASINTEILSEEEKINLKHKMEDISKSLPNNVTTEMGICISNVAKTLVNVIDDIPSLEDFEKLVKEKQLPREFEEKWDILLKEYGHRGEIELDIATPRFRDSPKILLTQIFHQAKGNVTTAEVLLESGITKRENAKKELESLIKQQQGDLKSFLSSYLTYSSIGGFRETHKDCIIYAISHIRQVIINIAELWVKNARLRSVEDIWNLTLEDIYLALNDPTLNIKKLADYRKKKLLSYRPKGDFPKLIDSRGKVFRYKPPPAKEGELIGFPISSGIVKAPVKVLNSPNEKPLLPGEILVARATNPGWTPLFINASGILLEVGGILQHGALVAREYGKPCVAGIENLTTILKDGMIVELDGSTGIVKIIKEI